MRKVASPKSWEKGTVGMVHPLGICHDPDLAIATVAIEEALAGIVAVEAPATVAGVLGYDAH